jgi:hypothetical protein
LWEALRNIASMRGALIVGLALALSGCGLPMEVTPITRLSDMRFVSVSRGVDAGSLAVEFTVATDLRALSQEHARYLSMQVRPCHHEASIALLHDPKVYDAVGAIVPRSPGSSPEQPYRFHLPIRARTLRSVPSYDLTEAVEDICFSVAGAGPGLFEDPAYIVVSNSATIPSAEIAKALVARP